MSAGAQDELACINGIEPKVRMVEGDEREVSSMSSTSVYKIKRTWDHYYCSCPAWRNQGGNPINARTCKHLKALLGDAYEAARIKLKNPHAASAKQKGGPAKKKTAAPAAAASGSGVSKRRKAGARGDDDVEGEEPKKRARRTADVEGEEDQGEEEEEEEEELAAPKSKGKTVPKLLLAVEWTMEKGPDPTGWWISEKLDGVRTYYDGKSMISRLGNPFVPPQWFLDKLPKDVTLDGELFAGRGQFQSTVSIVRTINSPHWKNIVFKVFDMPSQGDKPFEERMAALKTMFGPGGTHAVDHVEVVKQTLATGVQHVLDELKAVETLGGEGLMLRKPGSLYEGFRSISLLKVKTFYDAEAIVTGYSAGKGRNDGVVGALKCTMASGKTFSVGTGLSYQQRKKPPKIGAVITYRFQELTKSGVPRFPSYVGEVVDKTEAKDAEVPEHRKVKTATE